MEGFLDFYSPRQEELAFGEALFCSLDFETTGLYPQSDYIIEAGALRFRGGKEIDSFETFVRPGKDIPEASLAVHGISDEMVADAPGPEQVLPELLEFIDGAILIAHNINFDLSFLSAACSNSGLKMPKVTAIDTCSFARAVLKGERSYSLQNLAERYSLNAGRQHRALDDTRTCISLFQLIVSRIPGGSDMTAGELVRLSRTRPFS